jgi:hypothetical protein
MKTEATGDGRPGLGDDGWLGAVRTALRATRAPESLRARIGAMLAVEHRLGP